MFTGIVEEMGVVKEVVKGLQGTGLTVFAKTVLRIWRSGIASR